MIIGITGKSYAGKDFICTLLKPYGWREINLDALGHLALEQKAELILQNFPAVAQITSDGNGQKNIDRKKLGDLVFRKASALHKLESIVHPHMKELVFKELNRIDNKRHIVSGEHTKHMDMPLTRPQFILNAAILERLGLLPLCDLVLWVKAPLWLRAWRSRRRDSINWLGFLQRNWTQRKLQYPDPQRYTRQKEQISFYCIRNYKIRAEDAIPDIIQQLKKIPQLQPMLKVDDCG